MDFDVEVVCFPHGMRKKVVMLYNNTIECLLIQGMFKSDQDAPGILKQFSLRLDALEVNLEATDNARYAENMEWEGRTILLSHQSRLGSDEGVDGCHVLGWRCQFMVEKKYVEIEDGSCIINTWDILKRELKSQFFPENTAFKVRKVLLECKHTRSVREYCQAFSALMLDISDMSAVDKLFFFMEGLKPWARTELHRRRVNNLNEVIITTESLQITTPSHRDPLREKIQAEVMVTRSQGVKCQTKVGAVKAVGRQTLPHNRRVELGSKPSLTLAPAEK
ncbi:hypothetical protein RJ639_020577 [Escallonia herrerae]|uniref:Retrotransposon gag domain-containing protein n=1 Tax=Escallonia herrerae TaxID=1293975 RepID=A0AA89AFV2_9ASTE|nr:hypothetical protein RJ639_020577 [Escallonia herrerae]